MNKLISAYTTSRNSLSMGYPIEACLESLLGFASEVVVVDSSDGSDGTKLFLKELQDKFGKGRLVVVDQDPEIWHLPNHGIYDGLTKAKARQHCTGQWLWQSDLDEVVPVDRLATINSFVEDIDDRFESGQINPTTIWSFPVVEFWGSKGKVRLDINLEKPRFSLNHPSITHGIPLALRKHMDGLLYAKPGTDGCDYIDPTTNKPLGWISCVPNEIRALQEVAKHDEDAVEFLSHWFFARIKGLPYVKHYSWWSIEKKINHYKLFWTKHWQSLYGENLDERANPMFPGKTWAEITDEEIKTLADRLEQETGGWVFHQPWDGSRIHSMKESVV